VDWGLIAVLGGLGIFIIGSRWGHAHWVRTMPEGVYGPGGRLYGRCAVGRFVTWWLRRRIDDPALIAALHAAWTEQQAGRPNPHAPSPRAGGGSGGDLGGCLDIFRLFD
jgi:uncharacterized protein YjeT (DUF2065 family)